MQVHTVTSQSSRPLLEACSSRVTEPQPYLFVLLPLKKNSLCHNKMRNPVTK